MKGLPEFRPRRPNDVRRYIAQVLGGESVLYDLIEYDDSHSRAGFDPGYFALAEDREEPSRSQWNTLKKRMKRIDSTVFVFKEHGETTHNERPAYYIDFGFFINS